MTFKEFFLYVEIPALVVMCSGINLWRKHRTGYWSPPIRPARFLTPPPEGD